MNLCRRLLLLSCAALPLLLGACDYFATPTVESSGAATGEVIEGSISDGMIPTDELTSQPPILDEPAATGGSGSSGGSADSSADAPADEAKADEGTAETSAAPAEDKAAAED